MKAPRALCSLLAVVSFIALGGCVDSPATHVHLSRNWSGLGPFFVSSAGDQTVLSGINPQTGAARAVAVLPSKSDTRLNRSAQLLQLSADTYLLALAPSSVQPADIYRIDAARHSVEKVKRLSGTGSLYRTGETFVGVRYHAGAFTLQAFDQELDPTTQHALPVKPSYVATDPARQDVCYAGGDGSHQAVATYQAAGQTVSQISFMSQGNLTAVTCTKDRAFVAVGDLAKSNQKATEGRVLLSHAGVHQQVTILTATRGSSGKIASANNEVYLDVAARDGRDLLTVDATTGAVTRTTPLPSIGAVQEMLLDGDNVIVEGQTRLYELDRMSGRRTSIEVPGRLYDMGVQLPA